MLLRLAMRFLFQEAAFFKWRGLEEREVVARGFGFIIGEIRTLLEEVRMRFTGGVVVLDLWSSVQ